MLLPPPSSSHGGLFSEQDTQCRLGKSLIFNLGAGEQRLAMFLDETRLDLARDEIRVCADALQELDICWCSKLKLGFFLHGARMRYHDH